ncbi:hypothetical protein [Azospirillum sp. SYSU D00513]|uniref:hypothetical protein n=1 Tax=Azospirillum sp. SYSU D00513 TaxID=2812561 RepID=UPI001A957DF2|nr:hypothetical protein [Azospirillum sp. SYSU D00513]
MTLETKGMDQSIIRIGVVGTGFVSKHFVMSLDRHADAAAVKVLTRRPTQDCTDYPRPELLTNSLDEVLEACDVLLECTGDPIYATDVIDRAVRAGRPVVTMNTEFHITAGSWFAGRGLISEAAGDQPGVQAEMAEELRAMGFEPVVYGNLKGFLNKDPSRADMEFWGAKQGISLPMVTSFTDGTKVSMEQALVANGLGGTIARTGMLTPENDDLQAAGIQLAEAAEAAGGPIADYVLSRKLPHGVFIVARHDERQQPALQYLRAGQGPYYVILKNNIFVHLEILKTIRRVARQKTVLLDNSASPTISVASIAKRDLRAGERLPYGIGSFDIRGEAVRIADYPGHLPIGLLYHGVLRRAVKAGDVLSMDDVELPESLAFTAWREIERRALAGSLPAGVVAAE